MKNLYPRLFALLFAAAGSSFFSFQAYAQAPDFAWATTAQGGAGGPAQSQGRSVCKDNLGNSYVAGSFTREITLDATTLVSSGSSDIFLAKYDALGNVLWAIKAGGAGEDLVKKIAVDNAGNVFLTGSFNLSAQFGTTTLTSAGASDVFLARYTTNGDFSWAMGAGGVVGVFEHDASNSVTTDAAGNAYITGTYGGAITFGNSTFSNGAGFGAMFLVKVSPAGQVLWAKNLSASGAVIGADVVVAPNGDIYVGGTFSNYLFLPGGGQVNGSGGRAMLLKFDPAGNYQWIKFSTGVSDGSGVAMDALGNVFLTGGYYGSAGFGNVTLTSNNGSSDAFLVKYNAAGTVLWAKSGGSPDYDIAYGVIADGAGNAIVYGLFQGTATFNSFSLATAGHYDGFAVKYNASGTVQWALKMGGALADIVYGATTDASGNPYFTGVFSGSGNFGSLTLTSLGTEDLFLAKYDAAGAPQFVKQPTASTVTGQSSGHAIARDAAGNTYTTGAFIGTATFGAITLTSSGDKDIFIAKTDASGNYIWAKRAGGSGLDEGNGIALDPAGNCYLTGSFENTASFDNLTATANGNPDTEDVFVAKYDAAGNAMWVRRGGAWSSDHGWAIAADAAGNVYATGEYYGPGYFSGVNFPTTGSEDCFVIRYDTDGTMIWVNRIGGATGWSDSGKGIAIDGSGNVYVTGFFAGTFTAGIHSITFSGNHDVFIAKYDATGNLQWIKKGGGSSYESGTAITVDATGNSYITGFFNGTVTFGSVTLVSSGGEDIFLAKYDPSGNILWAKKAGGSSEDTGTGISVDAAGNIYLVGQINNHVPNQYFSPGGAYTSAPAVFGTVSADFLGSADAFVAKYDASGEALWVRPYASVASDKAAAIALDTDGYAYLAGSVQGNPLFGSVPGTPTGSQKAYVAKLYNTSNPNSLTVGGIAQTTFCQASVVNVPFTVTGSLNSANVFTAQLSDASGSFQNPVTIGTLPGTAGGTIAATIPATTPFGTGYRIRVVSSHPINTSADNGTDLTINAITLSASQTTLCLGATAALSATGGTGYSWFGGAGLSASSGAAVTATPAAAGTYSYSVTGTAAGCTSTASVALAVNPVPNVAATTSNALVCQGTAVTLAATGGNTYSWTTGQTSASFNVSPASTTVYTLVGFNTHGCPDSAMVTVNVNPAPVLNASVSPAAVCPGEAATFSAGGADTYYWNLGYTDSVFSVFMGGGPTFTAIVTGTGANGCTATDSATLTIHQMPGVYAFDLSACNNSVTTIQTSALPGSTFQWSGPNNFTSTYQNPVIPQGLPVGVHTFTVAAFNNGCSDTATVNVDVLQSPTAPVTVLSTDSVICYGSPVTLWATSPDSLFMTWNNQTWYGDTITDVPFGTTTYTATGFAANGCTATSLDYTVTVVYSLTTTPVAAPDSIAPGQLLTLFVPNAVASATYSWSGPGLNQTTGATVTANPTATGTLTYTVAANMGYCADTMYVEAYADQQLLVQGTGWNWVATGGSGDNLLLPNPNQPEVLTGGEEGVSIAADASGNTITLGRFKGTATFGSTSLTSQGSEDLVLIATNPTGQIQWAKQAGSPDTEQPAGVALDAAGNAYVSGSYTGTAAIGTNTLMATGAENTFMAKYSPAGNVLWVRNSTGTGTAKATGLATDAQGYTTVTGTFTGTVDMGTFSLVSAGNSDVFVAQYSPSGDVVWVKQFGSAEEEAAFSIAADAQGNTYFTGVYAGNISFGSNSLTNLSTGFGRFYAKLDAQGDPVWALTTGTAASAEEADAVAVDANGHGFITGTFSGSATLGNTTLTSAGGTDVYLLHYAANSTFIWARRAGGTGDDFASQVSVDAQGLCYLSGAYTGPATFGSHYLSSFGNTDIFAGKYDMAGNCLWVRRAGGIAPDAAHAIAADAQGNSYLTGYFSGTATFNAIQVSSNGQQDLFIAQLSHIPALGTAEASGSLETVSVYPNPFAEGITVAFTSVNQSKTEVSLTDVLGRCLFSQAYATEVGTTQLHIAPARELPQGVYLLQLKQGESIKAVRVIKQ